MASKPDPLRPKRSGTVFRYVEAKPGGRQGHYVVRCSAPDGSRPLFHLDPSPKSPKAKLKAQRTAEHITETLWTEGLGAVPHRGGKRPAATHAGDPSVWFDRWIAHRERKGYTSTRENASHYREHIQPAIPKDIRDWTPDDLRHLSLTLDAKVQAGELSWKTAANVWGTASKACKDACQSKVPELRVRKDNPCTDIEPPDRGATAAKQYLYPSEFLQFVHCETVPLLWRRALTLAIYMFPRASEQRMLKWEDVDLEHGTVHIHRSRDRNTGKEKPTKSEVARRFSIEPALLPLIRALHANRGDSAHVVTLPSDRDLARGLRRWLKHAGVDREELHTSTRTRKAMTWHGSRATGLTWLAIRGDDPLKIKQRAGHSDFKTTEGYIREAEAIREGFGEVFPPLPPELFEGLGVTAEEPLSAMACDSESGSSLSQELSQELQVFEIVAGRTGLECCKSSVRP